jgi:very-short-patch-repair endonuclease
MDFLTNQMHCLEIGTPIQPISKIQQPDPTSRLFKFRNPEIYSQLDRSKYSNEEMVKIDKLTYGSHKKLWWFCNNGNCNCHKWETTINHRTSRNAGCPFCNGKKTCMHLSFMNNPLLKDEFDQLLNPGIDPYMIRHHSHKKLTWKCSFHKNCNEHIWIATVNDRSNNHNCPFCNTSSITGQVCSCNNMMNNPLLKDEFDFNHEENKNINPYKLTKKSGQIVWWRCSRHKSCNEHIWKAAVYDRSVGGGCPFCNGSGLYKQICSCDCIMNNPFTTTLALEFDFNHEENKNINPYKLSKGSGKIVWWRCFNCSFSWKDMVNHRSYGSGCPSCVSKQTCSKGEERIRLYLEEELNIETFWQIKFKEISNRRFDFAFKHNNKTFIIEMDGCQHFKYTKCWHQTQEKFLESNQIDKIKTIIPIILEHNILRISNDDKDHIKMCIDCFIKIKSLTGFCDYPLIVFDDYSKYQHLTDNCNKDLIRKLCDDQHHNKIFNRVKDLYLCVFDIKTNSQINVKLKTDL